MQTEKKTFTKAEVEVIRFEKTDVISTSYTATVPEPFVVEEGSWD